VSGIVISHRRNLGNVPLRQLVKKAVGSSRVAVSDGEIHMTAKSSQSYRLGTLGLRRLENLSLLK